MLKGLILLASYSFYGDGAIGEFLDEMAQQGFFTYLLPFLLIFALVFAILERTKIFKDNKTINGIIALVVGLMALQFDFVSVFFVEVFPRLGVGLAIILLILIMVGLFADPKKNAIMYTIMGIAAIIVVVILIQTAGAVGWSSAQWWYDEWKAVAVIVGILVALGIIVGSANPSSDQNESILARALSGNNN